MVASPTGATPSGSRSSGTDRAAPASSNLHKPSTYDGEIEDLVEDLARGNVTEVKVMLTSVAVALAAYQLVLISVVYRKVRPRFLQPAPAGKAHRASGDAIVVLLVVVAVMCLSYFGLEEGAFHAVTGALLLAVLGLKIVVLRWWHAAGRFLPVLGISVFLLLAATWLSTAGSFLA